MAFQRLQVLLVYKDLVNVGFPVGIVDAEHVSRVYVTAHVSRVYVTAHVSRVYVTARC